MSWVFVRDNGGEYSEHVVEFIDIDGYDADEAETLIRRTCPRGGWVVGKMEKDTCFWKGPLEPLHKAICAWAHLEDEVLNGISLETVTRMIEQDTQDTLRRSEERAAELEKTKHPKAAAKVRERAQEAIDKAQAFLKALLKAWTNKSIEVR